MTTYVVLCTECGRWEEEEKVKVVKCGKDEFDEREITYRCRCGNVVTSIVYRRILGEGK